MLNVYSKAVYHSENPTVLNFMWLAINPLPVPGVKKNLQYIFHAHMQYNYL